MKITKEARRVARKLFRACLVNHRLDEDRVRKTFSTIVIQKPRYYFGILKVIEKLVRVESQKHTGVIESPFLLNETHFQEVYSRLKSSFNQSLTMTQRMNPSLIGGLRIQVGSNVWDGSGSPRVEPIKIVKN